jgi:hypothetical protein
MSFHIRTDRVLGGVSVAWLAMLMALPAAAYSPFAFCVTVVLIAGNASVSLRILTRLRRVLIGLNCVQIALFGVLNYQLYCVFGPDHYWCDREPRFYDWIEFTVAHFFRAADVLDALDEYGFAIQVITHQSASAGLLLVCMHLTVDVFLIGLALRWLSRWWQETQKETYLERGRRDFGWLLATLALYGVFAVSLPMRPWDWLLWPLDNLLRLLDVGDMFQVFGWQLHSVEGNYWTRGAGLLFRLVAGFWTARLVIWMRMTMLRTWGLTIDELTELLDDPDAQVRRGAAEGLGQTGRTARKAAQELANALRDLDPEVRLEAARALGRIGAPAHAAVDGLVEAAWLGNRELRFTAIHALGEIGAEARPAVNALVTLFKVSGNETRDAIGESLAKIAPAVRQRLAMIEENETLASRKLPKVTRKDSWQQSLNAAQSLRETEEVIRALLLLLVQEGFFDEERDTDAVRSAFANKGHEVEFAQLFLPLLTLTTDGALARKKSVLGRWVYVCVSIRKTEPRTK